MLWHVLFLGLWPAVGWGLFPFFPFRLVISSCKKSIILIMKMIVAINLVPLPSYHFIEDDVAVAQLSSLACFPDQPILFYGVAGLLKRIITHAEVIFTVVRCLSGAIIMSII
jgi:hypothetical protein